MAVRYPIEYRIKPRDVQSGRRWLMLWLKNIGPDDLSGLDVQQNSLDAYNLTVLGTGIYIPQLSPGEEREINFRVSAVGSASLYATVDGMRNGSTFYWESPPILITVGVEPARIMSLFAMSAPYPPTGEVLRCEATILGLSHSNPLDLEFWADTPSGDFTELGTVKTKSLDPGEEAIYATEITPEEEGMYFIYAYLYDGIRRVDRESEVVRVRET
jgi:hypothetical protein